MRDPVNAFSLSANQSGVTIAAAEEDEQLYVWRIENDGLNTLLDSEIKLIRTITTSDVTISDFNTTNFSFS